MPLDELYDESLILEDGSIADLAYDDEAAPENGGDGEADPETLLLAMLAVADHAESDEEAQAAIAHIAAKAGGGEEQQQAEPVQQKLLALRNRLKAAGHKPAGSSSGGQFTSGSGGGGGAAAPGSGAVSTVLAGLPNKKSYRKRAAAALKVAKEKAVGILQRLSAVIIKADVIPIASDFAREALLKGAGSSNALQGVPLQDVATIATKALAWAWTRAKKKMGIKSTEGDEVSPAQAVHVVMELLYEMMDSHDLPMPSEAEIEKALADRKADAE